MYAVIQTGGKQYRVQPGDLIQVEKLPGQVGDTIGFDQVLFLGDVEEGSGKDPARVVGTIVEQARGDKVIVFKFKRRKMYRRKKGHRQYFTGIRIEDIELGGAAKTKVAAQPKKKEAVKPKAEAKEAKAEAKPKTASKTTPKKVAKTPAAKTASKTEAKPKTASKTAPQKEAKPRAAAETVAKKAAPAAAKKAPSKAATKKTSAAAKKAAPSSAKKKTAPKAGSKAAARKKPAEEKE